MWWHLAWIVILFLCLNLVFDGDINCQNERCNHGEIMLSDLGLLEAFIPHILLLFSFFPFFFFLYPASPSCHYPSSSHCPQGSANSTNSLSLTLFTSISWNLGLVDLSLGTTAVKTRKPDPGFVLSQPWIQSPGINTIMKPLLDFIPCPIGALSMGFCLLILLVTSWGMHSHKLEANKQQWKTTTNK